MRKMKTKKQLKKVRDTLIKEAVMYKLSYKGESSEFYHTLYRVYTELEIIDWILGEDDKQKTKQNNSIMDKKESRNAANN